MSDKKFLVVAGMHRSHTSLLGNMLSSAGLVFHQQMVGADWSNPDGHFEDVGLLRLQETILSDNGAKWHRRIDKPLVVSPARQEEGRALVEERFSTLGNCWGFKVPHSTLFLDYWGSFSAARFAFIYRSPRAVLSSLLRRMGNQLYWRPDAPLLFSRAYAVYNEKIAAFVRENKQRCFVISSQDLVRDPEAVLLQLSRKLGIELTGPEVARSLVRSGAITGPERNLEAYLANWLSKTPRVAQAYQTLQDLRESEHRPDNAGPRA